jgi:hypothetical protein
MSGMRPGPQEHNAGITPEAHIANGRNGAARGSADRSDEQPQLGDANEGPLPEKYVLDHNMGRAVRMGEPEPQDSIPYGPSPGADDTLGDLPGAEASTATGTNGKGDGQTKRETLWIRSCAELIGKHPRRRPAVIEELLRLGETMNIIAAPKIGKSWLSLLLAFAVANGWQWLGRFATVKGDVLLIDNELHPETSAHRLRTLATKLGLSETDLAGVSIINLRGQLKDLTRLGTGLLRIERDRYRLIIIDAFYRALPRGTDENDNGAMAGLYNQLDYYADQLGASFALIHHSSKGSQTGKAVTDVGSGAGAQSRATDTHLILRPHEVKDAVVVDAAVRSWAPVEPFCIRWEFPTWSSAPDLDPTALRRDRPRRAEQPKEQKPQEPPWTPKRLAETFGRPELRARAAIIEDAVLNGLSHKRATELLKAAIDCGYLHATQDGASKPMMISTVPQPTPKRRKKRRK